MPVGYIRIVIALLGVIYSTNELQFITIFLFLTLEF